MTLLLLAGCVDGSDSDAASRGVQADAASTSTSSTDTDESIAATNTEATATPPPATSPPMLPGSQPPAQSSSASSELPSVMPPNSGEPPTESSSGAEPSAEPSVSSSGPLLEPETERDGEGQTPDAGADPLPVPTNGADAGDVPAAEGSYDALVLMDGPVAYWAVDQLGESEPDLAGNGHSGEYHGPERDFGMLPNGDPVALFNGEDNYLGVQSSPAFSIPTTGNLTWEAWIMPEVLQFANDSGGYVNWMGKCADYSPSCEWEARMYNTENGEGRCNRISAYVFNPSAGLGSAADWQPECGLIEAGNWYHVVGQYTLHDAPSDCDNADEYPGSIEIWVNGVKWDHFSHGSTGCMSQYDVVPEAGDSPFNLGTMAHDSWFRGGIGKVAIYDTLLPEERIHAHYTAMTGLEVTGSCGDDCSF